MKGDFTRATFKPEKHYSGVRMQQGRVLLDADFNEQVDIQAYLAGTAQRDMVGPCGGPQGVDGDGNPLAGFQIEGGAEPRITHGRYYVDGILCEMEGEDGAATAITGQPDLPVASLADLVWPPPTAPAAGRYLAYLEVWQRHITALEDESIREVALRGPDTTTRARTVAQVKLLPLGSAGDESLDCASEPTAWAKATAPSSGRLRAKVEEEGEETSACEAPAGGGYRGLENQLYRVEVHSVKSSKEIAVKWSRENGSVAARWDRQEGNKLVVASAGRDQVLGFGPDDWVELTDDGRELRGEAGLLVQVIQVDGRELTIDPHGQTLTFADFKPVRKVRRWDMPGDTGLVAVDLTAADHWIELEKGVQVAFEPGTYRVGDYWLIPARTATRDVEWPRAGESPLPQLPHGIRHHYCRLAVLDFDGSTWTRVHDCRRLFPPLTEMIRFVYVGGDGQETLPGQPLHWPLRVGVLNGQTPLAGAVVQFRVLSGGGRVQARDSALAPCVFLAGSSTQIQVVTQADGMAACCWRPGAGTWQQQVEARLLEVDGKPLVDAGGNPLLTPVIFSANLSLASEVSYSASDCINPDKPETVQKALDDLCGNWALYYVSGDGQEGRAGEKLPQPLQVRVANGRWPVAKAEVVFTIVTGSGSLDNKVVSADKDGLAECYWTLGPEHDQRVEARLGKDESPLFVGFNASLADAREEAGIHVVDVVLPATGAALPNGGSVTLDDLAKEGIAVLCDRAVQPETIRRPTCFVAAEYPLLARLGDQSAVLVGYHPLVLASEVSASDVTIRWQMTAETAAWLRNQLDDLAKQGIDRLLTRLTLKGSFIWAPGPLAFYLDGDVLGVPPKSHPTHLRLPSGDGVRGGDFEMWFWLVRQPAQTAPGLGVIPRVNHGLLKDAKTDLAFSLAIHRDALQQRLPQGYVVDPALGFKPDDAARLADETGVRGAVLTVLVGESLAPAAHAIQETLAQHGISTWEVEVVADAALLRRINTRMRANKPPDMVIGSRELREELARAYPDSFGDRFIGF